MGGEVLRKKKSERGRMWEVGEREERRWGRGGRTGGKRWWGAAS